MLNKKIFLVYFNVSFWLLDFPVSFFIVSFVVWFHISINIHIENKLPLNGVVQLLLYFLFEIILILLLKQ